MSKHTVTITDTETGKSRVLTHEDPDSMFVLAYVCKDDNMVRLSTSCSAQFLMDILEKLSEHL